MQTLTRSTRKEFVAQFPRFTGMSTKAIREELVATRPSGHAAYLARHGWRLPTGVVADRIRENTARRQALAELRALYS